MIGTWVLVSSLGVVLLLLAVVPVRRTIVSAPLMRAFGRLMPRLSQTEETALASGDVWWDADLFSGKPDYRKLLAVPAPTLSEEEQAFIEGPLKELCSLIDDWQITHEERDLPREVWTFIRERGFLGMVIPKEYGGLGFSSYAHAQVVTQLATRSVSASVTVMVPNSLGPGELLIHYGTEDQRRFYLPRLARGQDIPCFALTSTEAGSDAAAISDTGVVCRDTYQCPYSGDVREDVLGIRVSWDKRYTTLAPVASLLGLAFRLYDPDNLLEGGQDRGITCALVPTDYPGVHTGRRHFPASAVFQIGPNWGHDVFIPIDWIIGGVAGIGQGWRMVTEVLAVGRAISLPAMAVASGNLATFTAGAYARIRTQFGLSVAKFEGVQEALARIAGYTYQMEAMQKLALAALDSGVKPPVISAILKYHCTERMRSVLADAMDVHAGKAVCLGPRNLLARMYQATPIAITVEGANILTRSMIIFGQGAIRAHPHLLAEIRAAREGDLRAFDRALWKHVYHIVSRFVLTLAHGVTGGRFASYPKGARRMKRHWQSLTRLSACFAFASEVVLLRLGGSLRRREAISARLGDVLAALYITSAVLKQNYETKQPEEEVLARWAAERALYDAQSALVGLLQNLPGFAGRLLKAVLFPLGLPQTPPPDSAGMRVSELVSEPTATRERLTASMYRPDAGSDEPASALERAFTAVVKAEEAERKLRTAVRLGDVRGRTLAERLAAAVASGSLDEREAELIRVASVERRKAVLVDEFDTGLHSAYPDVFERAASETSTVPELRTADRKSAAR